MSATGGAPDGNINLEFTASTEGVKGGSKEMQDAVKSLFKTVQATDKAMRSSLSGYAEAIKENTTGSQDFYTRLEGLEEKARKLRESLSNTKEASQAFDVLQNDIKRVQYSIEILEKDKEKLDAIPLNWGSQELKQTYDQLEQYKKSLESLQRRRIETNSPILSKQIDKDIGQTSRRIDELEAKIKGFEQADMELDIKQEALLAKLNSAKAELAAFEKQRDEMLKNGTAYEPGPRTEEQSQQLAVIEKQIALMKSAASTTSEYKQQMSTALQSSIDAEKQTLVELQENLKAVDAEQQQLGVSAFGSVDVYNQWIEKFNALGIELADIPARMEEVRAEAKELNAVRYAYLDGDTSISDEQYKETRERIKQLLNEFIQLKEVAINAFNNFGSDGIAEWEELRERAAQYADSIDDSNSKIAEMEAALAKASNANGDLSGESGRESISEIEGEAEQAGQAMMSLKDRIAAAFASVGETLAGIGPKALRGITMFGQGALQAFSLVTNGLETVFAGFSRVLSVAVSVATVIVQWSFKAAQAIARIAVNALKAAASLAKIAAGNVLNFLRSLGTTALNVAKNLAHMALSSISNGLHKIADGAANAASQLARMAGNAVKSGLNKIISLAGSVSKSFLNLGSAAGRSSGGFNLSFKSLMRYGLGVRSTFALINKLRGAVKDAVDALVKESPRLNTAMSSMATSLNLVKNSLATAFEPIITTVAPYIKALLDMVASALTTLGEFFATLTGKSTIFQAKRIQVDYAKSLDKTTDSTKKANKATGKTAKNLKKVGQEAEDAENQLAGFDHLNILSANKSSSPDSNLSGIGDAAADAAKDASATQKLFDEKGISGAFAKWFKTIKSLFKQGKFNEIGKLIAKPINNVFKKLNTLIDWKRIGKTVTKYLNALTEIFNSLVDNIDWRLIGDTFAKLADSVLNTAYILLTGIDWENIGKKIGEGIDSFVNGINWDTLGATLAMRATLMLRMFTSALLAIDWEKFGDNVGIGINSFIDVINDVFENIDFKEITRRITNGLNNAIATVSWYDIGATLGNFISTALDTMLTFVQTFNWKEAGLQLANAVEGLTDQINSETIGDLLVGAMNGAIGMLTSFVSGFSWNNSENGKSAGSKFGATVNRLVDEVDWAQLGETFGDMIDNAIQNLLDAVRTFEWGSAGTVFASTVNGLSSKVSGTQLGELLAAGINGALEFILNAVRDFKWGEAGLKFGQAIKGLRDKFNSETLGQILKTGIDSALKFLLHAVSGFTWGEAGAAFGDEVEKLSTQEKLVKLGGTLSTQIGAALYKLRKKIEGFDLGNAGTVFANTLNAFFKDDKLWSEAGKTISEAIKALLDFTDKFVFTFNYTQFANDVKALFRDVPWSDIASTTWRIIRNAFKGAGNFLTVLFSDDNVDYKGIEDASARMEAVRNRAFGNAYRVGNGNQASTLGASIGNALMKAFNSIDKKAIGTAFSDALKTALDFATALVDSIDVEKLGNGIRDAFADVDWAGVADKIWELLSAALRQVIDLTSVLLTGKTVEEHTEKVVNAVRKTEVGRKIVEGVYADVEKSIGSGKLGWIKQEIATSIANGTTEGLEESLQKNFNLAPEQLGYVKLLIQAYEQYGTWDVTTLLDGSADGSATADKLNNAVHGGEPYGVDVATTVDGSSDGSATADKIQTGLNNANFTAEIDTSYNGGDTSTVGTTDAEKYWNAFKTAILNGNGTVKDTYVAAVANVFGGTDLNARGVTNAQSFWAGWNEAIENGEDESTTTLMNAMNGVIGKTETDVVEQGSPSKRAERSGKWYMEGFGIGITDNKGTTENTMTNAMNGVVKIADDKWSAAGASQKEKLSSMNTDLNTSMNTMKNTSLTGVQAATKPVYDEWKATIWLVRTALASINKEVTTAMSTMANGTNSGMNNVRSAISNGMNSVYNSVRSTASRFYDVGASIVQGIERGIRGWWNWLNTTVWNLAIGLYNTARSALGIHSPSKLFKDEVGYMVGLGLAEGIDESEDSVLDSVSSLASQMVDEMDGTAMTANLDVSGSHMLDGLDSVLSVFSDKVENSFVTLVSRLETISTSVAFRTPVVAAGTVMPYSFTSLDTNGSTGFSDALEASTNDLASVIIQATNQAALAIVRAIQQSGGNATEEDIRARTDKVIAEINRRTRAQGSSPLLI